MQEHATRTTTPTTPATPLWRGLEYGPAAVVLVPRPVRGLSDLPESWQSLAQRFQVAWCVVPDGVESLHRVEDVVETLADRNSHTQVVAHASLADVAARVVAEFGETVQGLILVGAGELPEPGGVRVRRVVDVEEPDLADEFVVAAIERALRTGVRAGRVSVGLPAARLSGAVGGAPLRVRHSASPAGLG
ncbi:hypothetical protein [Actinokineospora pegani]|uniref:hypothetical protein n=1 Tax=Actinokineospora pegani TaxID=2654637 RepID=UPI0012E9A846|nr:hypothetical protein [Actinokineospora pegani]